MSRPVVDAARLLRARVGITVTFALAGLVAAVGAVRIPALTDKLDLDAGQVGTTMLCAGIGATAALQVTRYALGRFGSRRVVSIAGPATAVLSAGWGLAPTYSWLLVAVLAFGFTFGVLDGSMNAQAAVLERVAGRHLMNGAHAGWSVGAVSGGGVGALTAYLGLSYTQAIVGTAIASTPFAFALLATYLPDEPSGPSRRSAARVPRVVYLVGAVTFASFVIEGAVSNWSGLYIRDDLHAAEAIAAIGYPSLEAAMIVGRSVGDRVRRAAGSRLMLSTAGILAATGFGIVIASRHWSLALLGFFVVGLAVSTVVPLTFSIAGVLAPSGAGIAQAAALGYVGMLLGPVVIGFVADGTSLRVAFGLIVGLALVMSALGRLVPAPDAPAAEDDEHAAPAPAGASAAGGR